VRFSFYRTLIQEPVSSVPLWVSNDRCGNAFPVTGPE
jgi:hypothetical protein